MYGQECKECKGPIRLWHSIPTCSACGLEQGPPGFEDEFDVMERAAPFESMMEDFENKQRMATISRLFNYLSTCMDSPSSVCDLAEKLYTEYVTTKGSNVKGELRQKELGCACFYFASRSMISGFFSHQSIIEKVTEVTSFQWAVKDLEDMFSQSYNYKHLFKKRIAQCTDSISKMLGIIVKYVAASSKKPEMEVQKLLRPTVFKIYEKIGIDHRIKMINPEKLNPTLILMACKINKVQITLKRIAQLLSASEPTIIKFEKLIKEILSQK